MTQDNINISYSAGDLLDVKRSIMASLEDRVRALKSRRNELTPIYRLPVEILCIIFSLIGSSWSSPESWINFTRVSRHWRSIALSAPELWTNIPLTYSRWAQEMLIRSKMAKLTIRCSTPFKRSSPKLIETFRSCLDEMNRVKKIAITVSGLKWKDIFWGLPKSAPHLHTLFIQNDIQNDSSHRTVFSIHETFFYDTERLQRVELINCKISWDSQLLAGLTCLTLIDSLKANSSIIQFLCALQRMPALTDLHLIDSIPDDSEDQFTYPVVDLPCLQVLEISSGVGALTAALRHITFPHSAILNLTCKENQPEPTQIDFSNFFSVLYTKFLSSLVIRTLSLEDLGYMGYAELHGLGFYFWTTAIIQDWFLPAYDFPIEPQLQLVLSPELLGYVEALTSAFDAMNLSFLTQLHISTENYIDSQTWVKTIGKLPLLERVCAQGDSTHSFLEALVYKTKAANESKTAYCDVSFPNLRYILLESTSFASIFGEYTSVDMLLDYLMERCERNAEVQVLHLAECCYISSDDVERLKEIVVDVIWDGIEEGFSENNRAYDNDGSADESSSISEELTE